MNGILLNPDTGDLLVEGGALQIGNMNSQIIELVMLAARGEFKESPLIGGEIGKLRNGTPDAMWGANVKNMLNACGIPVSRININDGIITVK